MKKTSFFMMILSIPFILASCITSVTPDLLDEPSPRQELPDLKNELYMTAEPLQAEFIGIDIKNSGSSLFGYGEFFYIEKQVGDRWYMLAFDDEVFSDFSEFDNYGKVISPGEADHMRIEPEEYQLALDSGIYRIVKAFRYHHEENVFWLAAEFKVI